MANRPLCWDDGCSSTIHRPYYHHYQIKILKTKTGKDLLVKFRCERDSLVEVLTTAGRAVSSRTSTSMALGGVRIEAPGNHLTVVGTDLDLTVHVSTEAIGITDGVCVAPARCWPTSCGRSSPGR